MFELDSKLYKAVVFISLIICPLFLWDMVWGTSGEKELENTINKGRYYTTECKPVEININTGFFSLNKNKLNCNGVITNITTEEYDRSVKAYKDSLQK